MTKMLQHLMVWVYRLEFPQRSQTMRRSKNLLRRVQLQRQRRTGYMWDPATREEGDPEDAHPLPDAHSEPPEDAVSFMGRRPQPSASSRQRPLEVSSTSTSSETISSTEPHSDWRQTVIFTLDGRSTSFQLPGHDSDDLIEHAAIALAINKRDILRVQPVSHRPMDIHPGEFTLYSPLTSTRVSSVTGCAIGIDRP